MRQRSVGENRAQVVRLARYRAPIISTGLTLFCSLLVSLKLDTCIARAHDCTRRRNQAVSPIQTASWPIYFSKLPNYFLSLSTLPHSFQTQSLSTCTFHPHKCLSLFFFFVMHHAPGTCYPTQSPSLNDLCLTSCSLL